GLLAVTGLAAAASPGTAKADAQLGPIWSGYVSYAAPFSSVSADFIVPGATCSQGPGETGPHTGFWVGIGGASDIVQTGFQIECISGQPVYTGWHADVKGGATPISQPMQAGDQVHAAVACLWGVCDETVQDVTQNWSDTSSLESSDPGSVVAAVAAESGGGGVTTGQVQVTNAMVNNVPIGQLNPQAMVQDPASYNGLGFLDPFPLDPTGTAFYFFWNGNPGS
ncbi:MAG TPA: hypothetical protein VK586_22270, partial [Streptosporangiaceae bacterium]|nr:hypothetical protein [Streptosporangiaceae bacterium]